MKEATLMDDKTKAEIKTGQPLTIVRLEIVGSVISQESYNMENVSLSDYQIEQLAKAVLPACEKFYADPENVRRYEAWKAEHEVNKQSK